MLSLDTKHLSVWDGEDHEEARVAALWEKQSANFFLASILCNELSGCIQQSLCELGHCYFFFLQNI